MTNLTELSEEVISYCKDNYPNCGGCGLSESCLVQIPITEHHINKNRNELNEELFDGMGIISAASYSHPSFSSYDDTWDTRMVDMYGYNPTRAKELLAEAGYGPDNKLKVL